ncbi:hypothetical protein [Streptomyces sp. NPDC057052]|uniref:hypothetical protein n=1 Tax=Streptomyces sp. NPDC057052 TaxID=3346010 RepID=UPI0036379B3F
MSEQRQHAEIVHWRRSLWRGALCEPVLLVLTPIELRAHDRASRIVFRTSPAEVSGRLTRFGTLRLDVAGRRYDLVGRGAGLSPAPSAEQERDLAALRRSPASAPAGSTNSTGAVDQLLNAGAAGRMRAWYARLGTAGARLSRLY